MSGFMGLTRGLSLGMTSGERIGPGCISLGFISLILGLMGWVCPAGPGSWAGPGWIGLGFKGLIFCLSLSGSTGWGGRSGGFFIDPSSVLGCSRTGAALSLSSLPGTGANDWDWVLTCSILRLTFGEGFSLGMVSTNRCLSFVRSKWGMTRLSITCAGWKVLTARGVVLPIRCRW